MPTGAAQLESLSPAGPTRSQHAYRQLRREVLLGSLKPGEKLKVEDLQRTFSLSNTPLREALHRLAAEGLVTADGRRGFRVGHISLEDFRDLTDFRLLVESEALRAAMAKGGDDWEGEIVAAAHRLEVVEQRDHGNHPRLRSEDWTERHKAFHRALIVACGSARLLATWSDLFDQAERYRRLSGRLRTKPRDARAEHRRLARLALARDAEAAVNAMRDHIGRTASNVAGILGKGGGGANGDG